MFSFEKLRVYGDSVEFVSHVYDLTKKWPTDERFGLVDQMRRASTSIVLNIAEGSSRTKKDFRHFLDVSRGSCYECVAIAQIALRRKYIEQEGYMQIYAELDMISRKLSALRTSIQ
jgi:four helix bundle protein